MDPHLIGHINEIISKERGYVNHPDDLGGETNFGITKKTAEKFGYVGEMVDMQIDTARDIYARFYWDEPRLDLIQQHSSIIALEVLDTGVNIGMHRAIKFLQRALNAFNKKGEWYTDLVVDGVMGENTRHALKLYFNRRSLHGEYVLSKALNCLQGEYYIAAAEAREENESFVFGWIKDRA